MHDSAHDVTDLIHLSRTLGETLARLPSWRRQHSQRVAEDQIAVKTTGRSLRYASAADLSGELRRLSDIVDDSEAGDAAVALT